MNGKQKYVLEHGTHRIEYATTIPMLVSVNEQPVQALQAGSGTQVLRNFEGTLSVDPSDAKTPYKFDIKSKTFPKGEKFDDIASPQPQPSPNWLTNMRERVKMSMGIIREEFAEQGKTMYEIDEGDIEQMRQDAASQAEKDAAKTEKAAESKSDDSDDGKPKGKPFDEGKSSTQGEVSDKD